MAKNAFLKKMQQASERKAKMTGDLSERWTRQAALDAVVLTLCYGESMKNDPWGPKRFVPFCDEFVTNLLYVIRGASHAPDADAIRADVDKLLKAKVPEERFREWSGRYPFWVDDTLEEEAKKMRGKWAKEGVDLQDGGTSQLLKGVGKE